MLVAVSKPSTEQESLLNKVQKLSGSVVSLAPFTNIIFLVSSAKTTRECF